MVNSLTCYSRTVSDPYTSTHEYELLDPYQKVWIDADKQCYVCTGATRYHRYFISIRHSCLD